MNNRMWASTWVIPLLGPREGGKKETELSSEFSGTEVGATGEGGRSPRKGTEPSYGLQWVEWCPCPHHKRCLPGTCEYELIRKKSVDVIKLKTLR